MTDTRIVEDFAYINARLDEIQREKSPRLQVRPALTDRDFSPSELSYYTAPEEDAA